MGCCQSHEDVDVVYKTNGAQEATNAWNSRRADVIKNMEALSDLYFSIETDAERNRLIDENREIFTEFFNLPQGGSSFYVKVDTMIRQGLHKYVKDACNRGGRNG